jgi:class 3 adenylate cyclase
MVGALRRDQQVPPQVKISPGSCSVEAASCEGDNGAMAECVNCGAKLPEAARFCPTCAAPVDHVPEAPEERKVATVLFADLVGSTALGSEQDPERTRALLDRFYDAMAEEIELPGGTVEKFVGDAVMAAFGAPAALEDHAERALHAALGMQRRLRELFGEQLALRIGVNTGEVVVGRPREGSSFVHRGRASASRLLGCGASTSGCCAEEGRVVHLGADFLRQLYQHASRLGLLAVSMPDETQQAWRE